MKIWEILKLKLNKVIKNRISFRLPKYFNFYLLIILISISFRSAIPINANYFAELDDALMVRIAGSLLEGNWIGNWDYLGNRLLAKGPGYPIFLAINSYLPFSPLLTVHFLIIISALLVSRELNIRTENKFIGLVAFALQISNPIYYGSQMSRVYRENLLVALTFLILAFVLILSRRQQNFSPNNFLKNSIQWLFNNFLLIGSLSIFISLFYLTKVSWQFLFFLIAGIPLGEYFQNRFKRNHIKYSMLNLLPTLLIVSLPMLTMFSVGKIVQYKNYLEFRVAVVDDFSQGNFAEMISQWTRVKSDSPKDFKLINSEMREKVYLISETAEKLKPFMETDVGANWAATGCKEYGFCDEPEAGGAWLPWDFRDALIESQIAWDAKSFQNATGQIALDISKACEYRILDCSEKPIALTLLPLSEISERRVVDSFFYGIDQIYTLSSAKEVPVANIPSEALPLWGIIKGVPNFESSSSYRISEYSLSSVYNFLTNIYTKIWNLIWLFVIIGGFLRSGQSEKFKFKKPAINFAIFSAVAFFIFQLSLLNASLGRFMTDGGELYLLPIYPLVITGTVLLFFQVCYGLFPNNTLVKISSFPHKD